MPGRIELEISDDHLQRYTVYAPVRWRHSSLCDVVCIGSLCNGTAHV